MSSLKTCRKGCYVDTEAIKGQAVAAVSAFNTLQMHTVDEIAYVCPSNMTVIDENTVIFETVRERALICRQLGGIFQMVGRQLKLPAAS